MIPIAALVLLGGAPRAARGAPRSPASALAQVYGVDAPNPKDLVAWSRAGPALRADHARALLIERYLRAGDDEAAAREVAALGLVQEAVVVEDGELRAWPGADRAGRLQTSAAFAPAPSGRVRLAFSVEAKRSVAAVLRIAATDAIRVWVDGQLLLERDLRRLAALDQESLPLWIPAGRHRLEVESKWWQLPASVALRLTGPEGGPVRGVRLSGTLKSVLSSRRRPAPRPASRGRFAFARPDDGLDRLPPGPRAELRRALALDDTRGGRDEIARDLRAAARTASGRTAAGWWRRLAHHHRSAGELEAALIADRRALAADPADDSALIGLARTSMALERPIEALTYLDAVSTRAGSDLTAAAAALRAELGFHFLSEGPLALIRLDPWLEPPRRPVPELLETLSRLATAAADTTRARAAARRQIELDAGDPEAWLTLVSSSLATETSTEARALLQRAADRLPMQSSFRLRLARLMSERAPAQALTLALESWPRFFARPSYALLVAELAVRADAPEIAHGALDRARALAPADPKLARLAEVLDRPREDPFGSSRIDAAQISGRPEVEGEDEAGAAVLARRTFLEAELDGRFVREVHVFLRLSDARARARLRSHRVPYVPSRESVEVLTARRWREGSSREVDEVRDVGLERSIERMVLDQRAVDFRFDDLDPGDVIELHVVIRGTGADVFHAFVGDVVIWQDDLPQADLRYAVSLPRAMPARTWTRGLSPPRETRSGDRATWTWTAAYLPALIREPSSPPAGERSAISAVSAFSSWSDLGRWYAERWREKLELDEAGREEAERLLAGATTDRDKLERLHRALVRSTRYLGLELGLRGFIPDRASEVRRRGWGDCKDQSTLLAAWLAVADIDAQLVLTRTTPLGPIPADAVSLWSFDHALLYVPGLHVFVDPTEPFSPPGQLPAADLGADALTVSTAGEVRRLTLPSPGPTAHLSVISATVTVGKDGEARVEGELSLEGALAPPLRADLEVEDRRLERWGEHLTTLWPGLAIEAVEMSDPRDIGHPLELRWRGRGRLTRVPTSSDQNRLGPSFAPLAARKTALVLPHGRTLRSRVEVRHEGSVSLDALPDPVTVDAPSLRYRRRVHRTPAGVVVDDELVLDGTRVAPEAYPAFRRGAERIDRAQAGAILVSRPNLAEAIDR